MRSTTQQMGNATNRAAGGTGSPAAVKKSLRGRLRQDLAGIDPVYLHTASVAACARLVDTPEFRRARAIMVYLPLTHEVDVGLIALRGWQEAKTVTVPLVSYEQRHMLPVELLSLDEPMETSFLGLRHPRGGLPIPVECLDLVVVPGLGFDRNGMRIGRGGGFYDRFLSQKRFRGVACGLGLEEQILEELPCQAHDVHLHMLVTAKGVHRFGSRLRSGAS